MVLKASAVRWLSVSTNDCLVSICDWLKTHATVLQVTEFKHTRLSYTRPMVLKASAVRWLSVSTSDCSVELRYSAATSDDTPASPRSFRGISRVRRTWFFSSADARLAAPTCDIELSATCVRATVVSAHVTGLKHT